jgi:Leucine-rich repeat (LRR) protein
MNTLNKTQVKRLANSLELAKLKHGSESFNSENYIYHVSGEKDYFSLSFIPSWQIDICHLTTYNSWKVEFNPLLSKTEINIILTKIEEELENE